MDMPPFFLWLDPFLVWFFRLTAEPVVNFFLGTTIMAILALTLGKIGAALVLAAGRHHTQKLTDEAKRYHDLSIAALKAGERSTYEAANKLANEAFGKSFFLGVAQSAGFLWPVGLILAWMQYRFFGLAFPIPLIGWSISFMGVFILLYILVWVLFSAVKKYIKTAGLLPGRIHPAMPVKF